MQNNCFCFLHLTGGQQGGDLYEWSFHDFNGNLRENRCRLHNHSRTCGRRDVHDHVWSHKCSRGFQFTGKQESDMRYHWILCTNTLFQDNLIHLILKFTDMNSSRTMFIFGFSLFSALAIPDWLNKYPESLNTGRSKRIIYGCFIAPLSILV